MPYYSFKNTKTEEETTEFLFISELDDYIKTHPDLTQLITGAPMIVSGRGMGKADSSFRDLLKEIKSKHSQGLTRSTINTDN